MIEESTVKRECEDCSVCCYVAEVPFENYIKSPHKKCLHVLNDKKGSCGIFKQNCRPDICNKFLCAWLRGFGLEEDRPNLSGVLINIINFNGGLYIYVVEVEEGAVQGKGKRIILDMVNKYDFPAIITSFGIKPPEDKGDLVVVKMTLLQRSKRIIGDKVVDLDNNVGLYKLISEG